MIVQKRRAFHRRRRRLRDCVPSLRRGAQGSAGNGAGSGAAPPPRADRNGSERPPPPARVDRTHYDFGSHEPRRESEPVPLIILMRRAERDQGATTQPPPVKVPHGGLEGRARRSAELPRPTKGNSLPRELLEESAAAADCSSVTDMSTGGGDLTAFQPAASQPAGLRVSPPAAFPPAGQAASQPAGLMASPPAGLVVSQPAELIAFQLAGLWRLHW